MDFLKKLLTPQEIIDKYPLSNKILLRKRARDQEIRNVFEGKSHKFLLIIGPCSADKEEAVIDYMLRLAGVQERVKSNILIIPRIYTSKPRTLGEGYKGLLHQPFINKEEDIVNGILAVRHIHKRIAEEAGLFGADEMLYPEVLGYISDLLSYVAVGARSVEDQQHRLVASGLKIPVGMKNPIRGDIPIMLNSISAAQHSHHFVYNGWEVISHGNKFSHGILRGYNDSVGNAHENYSYESLVEVSKLYKQRSLENMSLIVDCNHSNSGKQYEEQVYVAKDVLQSMSLDQDLSSLIKGLMIESYLVDGCQSVDGSTYGQSITDPCLGWEKSEKLIMDIHEKLKKR